MYRAFHFGYLSWFSIIPTSSRMHGHYSPCCCSSNLIKALIVHTMRDEHFESKCSSLLRWLESNRNLFIMLNVQLPSTCNSFPVMCYVRVQYIENRNVVTKSFTMFAKAPPAIMEQQMCDGIFTAVWRREKSAKKQTNTKQLFPRTQFKAIDVI